MTTPKRSPDQTAISISIEKDLLSEIDRRAAALGLSRSNYLAGLARQDLVERGPFTLYETSPEYGSKETNSISSVEKIEDELLKKTLAKAPAPKPKEK